MTMNKKQAEWLSRQMGARPVRHGANHDIWMAPNGTMYAIPRHRKDMSIGVERNIRKALGL